MAQYRLNAYDADVYIPEFRGLLQAGDQMGSDLRYSPDCLNIECVGGALQPVTMIDATVLKKPGGSNFAQTTGTMMYLRDEVANGSKAIAVGGIAADAAHAPTITQYAPFDSYLFATTGGLYAIEMLGDPKGTNQYITKSISIPNSATFSSNECKWTTYEIEVIKGLDPQTLQPIYGPANVLIFCNANGVYMYRQGTLTKLTTPADFTYVARYAERIWGVKDDTIYYSVPFKCDDWSQDNDNPANGGGEIRLPTFDDDKICAMVPFADSLIIFSRKRAWKVTGSDPSNFVIQEQYGNGCLYPNTIAAFGNRIIMMGDEGLVAYDGYQTAPFLRDQTKELFRQIKFPYKDLKATRIGHKYCLAFAGEVRSANMNRDYDIYEAGWVDPDHDAHVEAQETVVTEKIDLREGYKMMVYDEEEGTVTLRNAPYIISFCGDTPYCFALIDNSQNAMCRLEFDSWSNQRPSSLATKWTSPWITLGRQDIKKGGFEFYFTPELNSALNRMHQYWEWQGEKNPIKGFPVYKTSEVSGNVTFKITIQTEKKKKQKTYTVTALTSSEITAGKQYKMKRLHFGGAGRRFRVIIETESWGSGTVPIPWRLIGGIHIIAETDKD